MNFIRRFNNLSTANMSVIFQLIFVFMLHLPFVNAASQRNSSTDNGTIRIGYLQTETGPIFSGAAINLAIDRAQADGLLPGKNFRFD